MLLCISTVSFCVKEILLFCSHPGGRKASREEDYMLTGISALRRKNNHLLLKMKITKNKVNNTLLF